jgi:hypothetical protein
MVLKRIKRAVSNFLKKLAKENENTFGKGILDCCQLNRPGSNSKK